MAVRDDDLFKKKFEMMKMMMALDEQSLVPARTWSLDPNRVRRFFQVFHFVVN